MSVFGCASDEQLKREQSGDVLLEYIDELLTYCENHISYCCNFKKECESSPKGFYPAGVECRLSKEFKERYLNANKSK